jgi:hypothetical protein
LTAASFSAGRSHELIDRLSQTQLTAVAGLLESMLDPVSHALATAPLEDEEIGEEEDRAVARSKEWFKQHEGTQFEDVVAEIGFSMEQIRSHREPD